MWSITASVPAPTQDTGAFGVRNHSSQYYSHVPAPSPAHYKQYSLREHRVGNFWPLTRIQGSLGPRIQSAW